jgi:hypothetical protein
VVVLWYLTCDFCAFSTTHYTNVLMRSMLLVGSLLSSLQVGVDGFPGMVIRWGKNDIGLRFAADQRIYSTV